MSKPEIKIVIVGGGLAGLAAAMKVCEMKAKVVLVSLQPVKRSHSVCAQGGINAAIDTKGEGDSPDIHFYDTIKGGDFLAHQPPVRDMCHQAPAIIHLMDRMGVAFQRTAEGHLDFRRFGGTLYSRTAFAGATTGQQLLYALDEQVRRCEHDGLAQKLEWHEYLGAVLDAKGICRGAVVHDLRSGEIFTIPADAVVLATGGPGQLYGRSTNSTVCTGAAAVSAYVQGAKYANGEFIQIHPTAIPGQDKLRLMSESARGEGGRIWVPRKADDARDPLVIPEAERYYFLEENHPLFGNLVPRDVASREIHDVVYNKKLGVAGQPMVYLDLTHHTPEYLDSRLGGILDIYQKFTGKDPRKNPMLIFPAVHYSMGGLWVDYAEDGHGLIDRTSPRNQMTSITGLYAVGEADYQYHGANRLGANSLLSCIYGGLMMGPGLYNYAKNLDKKDVPSSLFDQTRARWVERFKQIKAKRGKENPYRLHQDLGNLLIENVLIVRENKKLAETLRKIDDIELRFADVECPDTTDWANPVPSFINQLGNMIHLARIITKGALLRDECRGAHYKPEFDLQQPEKFDPHEYIDYQERKQYDTVITNDYTPGHLEYMQRFEANNNEWLKTTIAVLRDNRPEISYEPVNSGQISPRPRKYD
jgi:succinate dehydrogenase / fumarate reductase flavoprotein subunit